MRLDLLYRNYQHFFTHIFHHHVERHKVAKHIEFIVPKDAIQFIDFNDSTFDEEPDEGSSMCSQASRWGQWNHSEADGDAIADGSWMQVKASLYSDRHLDR